LASRLRAWTIGVSLFTHEWLQQATLAIRAEVPIETLRDTIPPFPTFSEAFLDALKALEAQPVAEEASLGASAG
jgi:hypothetical protein